MSGDSVIDLFEKAAQRAPSTTALVTEDGTCVDYGSLDDIAERIKNCLLILSDEIRDKDSTAVTPLVALLSERNVAVVASMLAVLKAGAAYVPVDPGFPVDRQSYILTQSRCSTLLCDESCWDKIQALGVAVPPVCVVLSAAGGILHTVRTVGGVSTVTAQPDSCDAAQRTADMRVPSEGQLAYVLYTSGSTGKPKGVMVTAKGVANIIKYFADALCVTPGRVVMALTTFCFDISMLELFIALTRGATVMLANSCTQKDPFQIIHLIETYKVTIFQATPTTYEMLLAAGWSGSREVDFLVGGEAFRSSILPIAANCSSMRNVYGPTETTIWSSSFTVPRDPAAYCLKYGIVNALPIGEPISETDFYVAVNESLSLLPTEAQWSEVGPGVEGELFIGGAGVATGYMHAPDLTKDRFFPNPFRPRSAGAAASGLIYRTGDIVKLLPDGNYLFARRADAQVKIDGYRIELEEVEEVYNKFDDVDQVVVLVRHNKLVLYIKFHACVTDPEETLKATHLLASRALTTYMRPKFTLVVDKFPTTPNGKLDKNMLPDPPDLLASLAVAPPPAGAVTAPVGANPSSAVGGAEGRRCVSSIVCDIIQGYKGVRPATTASLAAFGLDSLGAVLLIRQLKTALPGIEVKLTEIFAPGVTISSLGEALFARASAEQRKGLRLMDESFAQDLEAANNADSIPSPYDHFSDALAENIRLVEGLRGVCTFMVLWNHWHASQTPLSQAFNVDTFLFILISGYTTALQCRQTATFEKGESSGAPGGCAYRTVDSAEAGDVELAALPRDSNDSPQANVTIVSRTNFAWKSFLRTKAIGLFPILWIALIMAIPMWIAQFRVFHDADHASNSPGDAMFGTCIGLYFIGMNEWAFSCTNIVPHITYASSLWNILIIFGTFLSVWTYFASRCEANVDVASLYRTTDGFTDPEARLFYDNPMESLKHQLGKISLFLRFNWYHRAIFSGLLMTTLPVFCGLFVLNAQSQLKVLSFLLYFMAGVWLASVSEMLSHRRYLQSAAAEKFADEIPASKTLFQTASGLAVQFLPDMLCVGGGLLLSGPNLDADRVNAISSYVQFVVLPLIMMLFIALSVYAAKQTKMCLSRLCFESLPLNYLGYCSYPVYLLQNIILLYYCSLIFRGEDGVHYEASHIDRGSYQSMKLWQRAVGVLIVLGVAFVMQKVVQDKIVGGVLAKNILVI